MGHEIKCSECGSIYDGQEKSHLTSSIPENQKKNSQEGQDLVEYSCSTNDMERKFLDACHTVEKLMANEAKYLSNLKLELNIREECRGQDFTLK